MIDFIITYWVQFVFGLLAACITTVSGILYRKMVKKIKEQDHMKDGILAILHDRLYQICQYYLAQGHITPSALKNIEYLYNSYHNLGGNGTGTELYNRVKKLTLLVEGVENHEN